MSGTFGTSRQLSLPGFADVTSSAASAVGPTPLTSPAGPAIGRYGQDRARASLSARQAEAKGLLTSGISGRTGSTSSSSASLQSSLASRLRARLQWSGSTLYRLTWKQSVTPSGQCLFRLRASVPRTSGTGFIGWPTPAAQDGPKGGPSQGIDRLPACAAIAGWPTPTAQPANGTPEAFLARKQRSIERGSKMGVSLTDIAMVAQLTGWPTPMAEDHSRGSKPPRPWDTGIPLSQMAALAGPARLTASGEMLTGSSAEMESGGPLSPEHSRWLMGYPIEWSNSADTAMQSFPRKRRRS